MYYFKLKPNNEKKQMHTVATKINALLHNNS